MMSELMTIQEKGTWPEVRAAELAGRVSPETLIRCSEPMSRRTTLRVGGPADLFVEPGSEQDLAATVRFCAEQRLALLVIGRGSNLLVKDGGYRGVVVSLSRPSFCHLEVDGCRISCGAGVRLRDIARAALARSLAGFEFLEGIPGSVGGALRMNAGAMGSSIFDLVNSVRIMDSAGYARDCSRSGLDVVYRSCLTLRDNIALSAVLEGTPGISAQIQKRMAEYRRKRWSSQPAAPSAGCIFKNPERIAAGKLIDELGLKGTRIGGAVVSVEHGNFIVTDGVASAWDVLRLIELIRERARSSRAIELDSEVQIVGE